MMGWSEEMTRPLCTESRGNLEKKLMEVVVDGGASESKVGEA